MACFFHVIEKELQYKSLCYQGTWLNKILETEKEFLSVLLWILCKSSFQGYIADFLLTWDQYFFLLDFVLM